MIPYYEQPSLPIGPVTIYGYGVMVLTGILVLTILFARVRALQRLMFLFHPFVVIFAVIQAGIGLIVSGLKLPLRLIFRSKADADQVGRI